MSEHAAYLRDQLLPAAPYRQWVLTVPWVLRYRLMLDRPLLGKVLGIFLRTLFAWQRKRGRDLGIGRGETGSITFVHRFGGALNAHAHFHSVIPDGLFVPVAEGKGSVEARDEVGGSTPGAGADGAEDSNEPRLEFVELPVPSREDLTELAEKVARRITALVEKLSEAEEAGSRLEETARALRESLMKAMSAPSSVEQLSLAEQDHEDRAKESRALCVKVAGFTLHAGQSTAVDDRDALERLCRYGLRAPFSQDRLSLRENGQVEYELSRPWPNSSGTTRLVLEPLELLERLAVLIPSPYTHLIRRHGCFASRSKARFCLPLPPPREGVESMGDGGPSVPGAPSSGESVGPPDPEKKASKKKLPGRYGYSWSQLIQRVFFVNAMLCSKCGGKHKVVSFLTDPLVVVRILSHLGLPSVAPLVLPSRAGSGGDGWEDDASLWEDAGQGGSLDDGFGEGRAPP